MPTHSIANPLPFPNNIMTNPLLHPKIHLSFLRSPSTLPAFLHKIRQYKNRWVTVVGSFSNTYEPLSNSVCDERTLKADPDGWEKELCSAMCAARGQ